jgi:GAF domain-containing protein
VYNETQSLTGVVRAQALTAFAETARHLYASEDLDDTLRRIIDVACRVIPAADMASMSLMTAGGIVTHAETNPLALEADRLQHQVGEGPCVDAGREHGIAYVPDTGTDTKWPSFSAKLSAIGLGSMLACGFYSPRPETGHAACALNLYAAERHAFSEEDVALTVVLAMHAGAVVDASLQQTNLRAAIQSRDVIGQAKGILMERHKVTADEAFDRLRQTSQGMNIKVRQLADRLTATGDSTPFV